MTELGKVCRHGSLERSCQVCELEIERDLWKSRAEKLAEALKWMHDRYEHWAEAPIPKIKKLLAEFEKDLK